MISSNFDVVVIGAGTVGANIAHALAQLNKSVALIDRSTLGSGTSANSFAWINATAKATDKNYFMFNHRGCQAYRDLARDWGDHHIGLHQTGMIESVSRQNKTLYNSVSRRAASLADLGYPVRWIYGDELRAIEPNVEFDTDAEGLFAFSDAWLDIPVFLSFLKERIRSLGGAIYEKCEALELLLNDDASVQGVVTNAGEILCSDVVLAVGPDTPRVMSKLTGYEPFEARFPVQRGPGLLVTTPTLHQPNLFQRILYMNNGPEVHIRPSVSGGLVIGAESTDGLIDEESSLDQLLTIGQKLLEMAKLSLPFLDTNIEDCTVGLGVRAVPSDGHSIIGPLPGANGLTVVVTHSGVTLGVILSQSVARWVASKIMPVELQPFGLERFRGFS